MRTKCHGVCFLSTRFRYACHAPRSCLMHSENILACSKRLRVCDSLAGRAKFETVHEICLLCTPTCSRLCPPDSDSLVTLLVGVSYTQSHILDCCCFGHFLRQLGLRSSQRILFYFERRLTTNRDRLCQGSLPVPNKTFHPVTSARVLIVSRDKPSLLEAVYFSKSCKYS
jgi:hypothetical protein